MSRFYAAIHGNREETTRQGTKDSGIQGHIRGRKIGCGVFCYVDDKGKDAVRIDLTSGSNGGPKGKHLGTFTEKDLNS